MVEPGLYSLGLAQVVNGWVGLQEFPSSSCHGQIVSNKK